MTDEKLKKYFNFFSILELISCFLLFGVAMPLKYGWDILTPMFPIGSFHGIAFMGYLYFAIRVRKIYKWDLEDYVFILMFAFIPFATWLAHKKVQDFENENVS
jgi:integral membrane protein